MAPVANSMKSAELTPYVSPAAAWALSLGTSIGWGSLVVTSNTYLSQAGPWGSTIGMIIGTIIMLVLSRNYHYLINCYPDAGGTYAFARDVFGYDYGFLTAWFLGLTYFAILWANASSLPLFARYFIGDIFKFGHMYQLFGYDVYIGEVLLSIAAVALVSFLCSRFKKSIMIAMVILAAAFCIGIMACFLAAIFGQNGFANTLNPAFVPDKNEISQVIRIACISPWAFIGFENISHSAEEYTFPQKKVFRILVTAVLTSAALYIFILLLSSTAYPPEYGSWLEYIRDLNNLDGIEGLPAFYAARHYMGQAGILLLIGALFALIGTSLIGNIIALSRLIYSAGRDSMLPKSFADLNKKNLPGRAFLLVAVLSAAVLFIGRVAIGWIVDVTTICATLVYGLVSAAALKTAQVRSNKTERATGLAGLILMILFMVYLLVPSLFGARELETETLFLLMIFGVLGFIAFRILLTKDKLHHFGKSVIVWIALMFVVLFISMIWMNQSLTDSANKSLHDINDYYTAEETDPVRFAQSEEMIREELAEMSRRNTVTTTVVIVFFGAALVFLLTNLYYINKRAQMSEEALGAARDIAIKDVLTGVKNKRAYTEHETAINEMIEGKDLKEFAVVVCDVNNLKIINDTKGHKAGDEYLCAASKTICKTFKHSPVFRIGGDEFVVLLQEEDYANRRELTERIRQVSKNNTGVEGAVVVAVGISEFFPGQDTKLREVFARADALMYENKRMLKEFAVMRSQG